MKNKPAVENINNLISGLIVLTSFLVPIFFLTTTYDFFEFNKMYFFMFSTALMVVLWCTKMILEKKVYISKSPADFGLLLLLASMILSTLTSLDKTSSLFGSYGRWFPSLFGFVWLYFFYYVVATNTNNAKKIRMVLYSLVAGTAIAATAGIVNYFGVVIPLGTLVNQKGFLLSGTTTALAVISLTGSVLAATLCVNVRAETKKAPMLLAFLVNFIAVAIFGGPIFIVLAAVASIFGSFKSPKENLAKSKMYLFPAVGAILAFVALFYVTPQTRTILQRDYPREILPSVRESWVVSSTTLRDFPIFGSGVSTFYLNYPRYRTLSENTSPNWNLNFDKPINEVFNIISSLGIFGLIAYGFLMTALVKMSIKSLKVNDAYKGLSVTLVSTLLVAITAMLLTYSSFQSTYLIFILMGLLTAEAAVNNNKAWAKVAAVSIETRTQGESTEIVESALIYKQEIFQYIITLPIVVLTAFGIYQGYLQYLPEYYIRQAMVSAGAQNVNSTYDYQVKAISVNPQRSQYHRMYANTNLTLAQSLSTKQDLSDQEKVAVQNLLAQSLRNVKFATENLNPLDPANWETRARVYRFLIPAAKDADQFAIQAYNAAIQLDPTNPTLRVELGGIYFGKEDYLSAGNLFKQAVNLKGDYSNAHYNLGHALFKLKAYADAKSEFEYVQSQVSKDSQDYELVTKDLEAVNQQLSQVAGAQSTKPSVQEIEQTGQNKTAPANQGPLTKPTDTPVSNSAQTTPDAVTSKPAATTPTPAPTPTPEP